MFPNGVIVPPQGTYLVNSFLSFESYNANDDPGAYITGVTISIKYVTGEYQTDINDQVYQTNNVQNFNVQTSGIFTSDGTGSLIVFGNITTMSENGTQYNIINFVNAIPQIQIVKIA